MKKGAFTIIELVMVIAIVGVMAATINFTNRDSSDKIEMEMNNIKRMINYVKSNNIIYDDFNSSSGTWEQETLCLDYDLITNTFSIDKDGNIIKSFSNDSEDYEKTLKSKITMKDTDGNNITRICFDTLGRLYKNDLSLSNIMQKNIIINLEHDNLRKEIEIFNTTGYVR